MNIFLQICLHMSTLDFLKQVADGLEKDSICQNIRASYNSWIQNRYHLAEKRIPSVHGQTIGLELEQFMFDAFSYAPSTALFEVYTRGRICTCEKRQRLKF
ncbi:hypothetical protein SAY87_006014 [Trapa incisa]|uniref:Uncharacterized protein n=1 Tax=Trapa incisa TaxID=236973 RepID=A0AAN7KBI9_9MYRT|nr:hypothetical protein SAY87_006014 [Trapa incisa]